MPNWNAVLKEISDKTKEGDSSAFDTVRRGYSKKLYQHTGRNVIAYYSGFLTEPTVRGIEITDEDKNAFMSCIHQMDRSLGLDLFLHTPGGDIAATESLVVRFIKILTH